MVAWFVCVWVAVVFGLFLISWPTTHLQVAQDDLCIFCAHGVSTRAKKERALTQAVAPGCVNFGRRAFAECCSLRYIGVNEGETNELAPGAQISPYVFESCITLSQVDFAQIAPPARETSGQSGPSVPRGMPEGSLCGSGIEYLKLPAVSL